LFRGPSVSSYERIGGGDTGPGNWISSGHRKEFRVRSSSLPPPGNHMADDLREFTTCLHFSQNHVVGVTQHTVFFAESDTSTENWRALNRREHFKIQVVIRMRKIVVLPEPEGLIRANFWPGMTSKLRFFRTCKEPKLLLILSIRKIGAVTVHIPRRLVLSDFSAS
jgi:hypothetical protein